MKPEKLLAIGFNLVFAGLVVPALVGGLFVAPVVATIVVASWLLTITGILFIGTWFARTDDEKPEDHICH